MILSHAERCQAEALESFAANHIDPVQPPRWNPRRQILELGTSHPRDPATENKHNNQGKLRGSNLVFRAFPQPIAEISDDTFNPWPYNGIISVSVLTYGFRFCLNISNCLKKNLY